MNVWTGTGNLTRDIELKYTAGGTAVCDLGLAINDRRKVGDQWQDVATFIDVTVFGRRAETCAEYLSKGSRVGVIGKLSQDNWTDKQTGQKRSKIKIIADEVEFLTNRSAEDQRPANNNYGEEPQVTAVAGEDAPF